MSWQDIPADPELWEFGVVLTEERAAAVKAHWGRDCLVCEQSGKRCKSCWAWRAAYARWQASGLPRGVSCSPWGPK